MTETSHIEMHSGSREFVRDAVIGLADGLTVPFALAAGLAGAISSVSLIVTAGLAEIAAGAIAMALGGYLAARGDEEHYDAERGREAQEVAEVPAEEAWEVQEILAQYGVTAEEAQPVVQALRRNPTLWTDFMMRFELGLSRPDPRRAIRSAVTIGLAYAVGGLVPLIPYMLMRSVTHALIASSGVTAIALALFGAAKSRFAGTPTIPSALKTLLVGAVAAAAAFLMARFVA